MSDEKKGRFNKPVWTPDDVVEFLQLASIHVLYAWRSRGEGPPAYRLGKHLRYKRDDVLRWFESKKDPA